MQDHEQLFYNASLNQVVFLPQNQHFLYHVVDNRVQLPKLKEFLVENEFKQVIDLDATVIVSQVVQQVFQAVEGVHFKLLQYFIKIF